MFVILSVMLGGSIGAVMRYGMYLLVRVLFLGFTDKILLWHSLVATALVNFIGSFILGFVFLFTQRELLDQKTQYFLIVGLLGSFTTFSTLSLENFRLIKDGHYLLAAVYAGSQLCIGVLCIFLGYLLASSLSRSMAF